MRLSSIVVLAVATMALLLKPGQAIALPMVSLNPGPVVSLQPGTATTTITFSITPDVEGVKGFALFFDVDDATSIVVQGCASPVDPAPSCPAGGTSFNFAVLDLTPSASGTFVAGSVDLQIPIAAKSGAAISLLGRSTITTGTFAEVILSQSLVARVPEPALAALMSFGFTALALFRRRR